MEEHNGEKTLELLQSQAHIWSHLFNFIDSISLKCAIQLEIPDIINRHDGPMPLSKLLDSLAIPTSKSHSFHRLMCILVHSRFFTQQNIPKNDQDNEPSYLLTPASRLLIKDEPLSLRPYLEIVLDPVLMNSSLHVGEWFQNESPTPFETAHGTGLWGFAAREPRLNDVFNEAMASDTRLVMNVVIKDCKRVFEGLGSIVDVGGGNGAAAVAIAGAFPNLDCTVFDLPHVVDGLEGSKNLRYVAGNMFEGIPVADAVLFKWILHCLNDEESVEILKHAKKAISCNEKGGKVIIIDMVVDSENDDKEFVKTQFFYDMQMMILVTGRERNEKDWAKLFTDVGFSDYKITPVLGLRCIIEVYL